MIKMEMFYPNQVEEIIQALQDAKDLISSHDSALLVAAIHGESGTPELRELNRQRMERIDRALVLAKGE